MNDLVASHVGLRHLARGPGKISPLGEDSVGKIGILNPKFLIYIYNPMIHPVILMKNHLIIEATLAKQLN